MPLVDEIAHRWSKFHLDTPKIIPKITPKFTLKTSASSLLIM